MLKFKSKLKKYITTIASIKASWLADIYISEDATCIKCPDFATYNELLSLKYNDEELFYGDDWYLKFVNSHDSVEVVKDINDHITEIRIIRTEYK